jgi:hypothetical protein
MFLKPGVRGFDQHLAQRFTSTVLVVAYVWYDERYGWKLLKI